MDDQVLAVRNGLTVAAKNTVPNFFRHANDDDDRTYTALSGVIKKIVGEEAWFRGSNNAFEKTLRAAIDQLPEYFSSGADYGNSPKRETAFVLFGFRNERITPRPGRQHGAFDYNQDILPVARATMSPKLEVGTYTRAFKEIRIELAQILIQMAEEAVARRTALARQSDTSALPIEYSPLHDYVPRLELYAELDAARGESHIIGLVGDGGTGKSTLAQRYVELHASGGSYIFADFRSDDDLAASLHESLSRLGLSAEGLSPQTSWLKLRDLLAVPAQWPAFIILDNVQDVDQRMRLGTLPQKITFVITARDDRVLPREAARIVVGDLSEEQAVQAVRRKLTDVTEGELRTLALLRGRVLAIDIACTFMRLSNKDRRKRFIHALQAHVSSAVNMAATTLGRHTLSVIYEELLTYFEGDPYLSSAAKVLELEVAYFAGMWRHGSWVESAFCFDVMASEKSYSTSDQFAFESALEILEKHHVIHIDKEPFNGLGLMEQFRYEATGCRQHKIRINFHPLALEILTEVLRPRLAEAFECLFVSRVREMGLLDRAKYARDLEELAYVAFERCIEFLEFMKGLGDPFFRGQAWKALPRVRNVINFIFQELVRIREPLAHVREIFQILSAKLGELEQQF